MSSLPTGIVTFLFTDVEGSTKLWEHHPDFAPEVMTRHDMLLEEAIEKRHGVVVRPRGEGDSRFAVFAQASDAIASAAAIQRALQAQAWPMPQPLRVRIALHTGEADLRLGDYYGSAVNRCARLRAIAHGGQILASLATVNLVRDNLPKGLTLRDCGAHRLKDLVRPEHVYQVDVPDLPTEFPPLNSVDAFPNNLPVQLTSFVGREDDITEAKRLLAGTRLLTLTGSGGAGKTRLSLQLAAEILEQFPEGVWFVELARITDPELVPHAVAEALGAFIAEENILTKTLIAYLRDKHTLLILDNCEHVVDGSAQFAEAVLRGCPGLKILASSREALGIIGETAWRLPSLALPDPHQQATVDSLSQCASIQLFLERARAARPDFVLTEENALLVAQICQRLDGLPLAIELATTRLRALSVGQIAARLGDRFRLLTGGSRTALPRHQTLRTLIDWSFDLLSDSERALLRRLAIFAGGLTLEAAESVCVGDNLDAADVLDVLHQLVNKSLIVPDELGGESRYRLLESIREYARERLLESGEGEAIRTRHLDYYIQWAAHGEQKLRSSEQKTWSEHYEREMDNVRAALDWALSGSKVESSLRLCSQVWYFWFRRGYWVEGLKWMLAAIEASPGIQSALRGAVIVRCAVLSSLQGSDSQRTHQLLTEAITIGRSIGDPAILALGLLVEAAGQLEYQQAWSSFQECIALARQNNDAWTAAVALYQLGDRARNHGDVDQAKTLYAESLSTFRAIGDVSMSAYPLGNLGRLAFYAGEYAQAESAFQQALAIARETQDSLAIADWLVQLGNLKLQLGQMEAVQPLFEECLDRCREMGSLAGIGDSLIMAARLAASAGAYDHAARLLGAAQGYQDHVYIRIEAMTIAQRQRQVEALRERMGTEPFHVAWTEGYAMPPEQVIAYALEKPWQQGGGS